MTLKSLDANRPLRFAWSDETPSAGTSPQVGTPAAATAPAGSTEGSSLKDRVFTRVQKTVSPEKYLETLRAPGADLQPAYRALQDSEVSQRVAAQSVIAERYEKGGPAERSAIFKALSELDTPSVKGQYMLEVAPELARAAGKDGSKREVYSLLKRTGSVGLAYDSLSGKSKRALLFRFNKGPAMQDALGMVSQQWAKTASRRVDACFSQQAHLVRTLTAQRVAEASAMSDRTEGVRHLQATLAPSIERDVATDHLLAPGWVKAETLNLAVQGRGEKVFSSPEANVVQDAISNFPGNPAAFVSFLSGRAQWADEIFLSAPRDSRQAQEAAEKIKGLYTSLSPEVQAQVVQRGFTLFFDNAFKIDLSAFQPAGSAEGGSGQQNLIREVLTKLIMEHIPDVSEDQLKDSGFDLDDLMESMMGVIDRLSNEGKARVLAAIVSGEEPKTDAEFFAKVLNSGGLLTKKLGQKLVGVIEMMLKTLDQGLPLPANLTKFVAIDREMLESYATALKNFRGKNPEMGKASIWAQTPEEDRARIKAVGTACGVGSVKQVQRVEVNDATNEPAIQTVAVVPEALVQELDESLIAVGGIKELEHHLPRVEAMLRREIRLDRETDVVVALRNSKLAARGVWVPEVFYSSSEFPLYQRKEFVPGKTLEDLSEPTRAENGELKMTPLSETCVKGLSELVRGAVEVGTDPEHAVMVEGQKQQIIVPDLHDANIMFDPDSGRIALIDPGQVEFLPEKQSPVFLDMVGTFALSPLHQLSKNGTVNKFMEICTTSRPEVDMRAELEHAYDASLNTKSKDVPTRVLAFLDQAAIRGVEVPDGFYALILMLQEVQRTEGVHPIEYSVTKTLAGKFAKNKGKALLEGLKRAPAAAAEGGKSGAGGLKESFMKGFRRVRGE